MIDAALLLIDNKNATTEDLMKVLPGPDFPTGGVIVEPKESILEAYETGRGSVPHARALAHRRKGARSVPNCDHRDSRIRFRSLS